MTPSRKDQHLDLCIDGDVGFLHKRTLLEDVELVHDALPELGYDEPDLSVTLFGKTLRAPILIAAMTGGADRAARINRELAGLAQELGLGFSFGSQRSLLERGVRTGFEVRDVAPSALLLGNIGALQAARHPVSRLRELLDSTGADVLTLHLNPTMECVQPEGDRDFRGCADAITRCVQELGRPLLVKETGAGMSRGLGLRLHRMGVRHVDVSGAGGTSWTAVETLRASGAAERLGRRFWDWGIPTAASLVQLSDLGLERIATGGIHDGLLAARALALGARAVGVARPLLQAWSQGGVEGARAFLLDMIEAIRLSMLLTGSRDLHALSSCPLVIGSGLRSWIPRGSTLWRRLPNDIGCGVEEGGCR